MPFTHDRTGAMPMSKHVLVIADIEDFDAFALEKARDISLPFEATLEIVKFIQCPVSSLQTETAQIEQAKQSLTALIQRVFKGNKDITSKVINTDNIAQWIVKHCQRKTVDLVVKSRHRTESLFHTPTDWQLIRQLSCPVLIASHIKVKTHANIVLALDLSTSEPEHQQLNALILSWGRLWSSAKSSQIHAVYSIPIAKPLLEFEVVDRSEIEQKKSSQATQKMQALLTQCDMNDVKYHICAGPPDKNIAHMASELHSNLVIIGSIGRKGISGYLLGNTAEKVLHNLRTDCLIVKLAHD
jgi:universal stress protein E